MPPHQTLHGIVSLHLTHSGAPFAPGAGYARGIAPAVEASGREFVLHAHAKMSLGPAGIRRVVLEGIGPFSIYVMAAGLALGLRRGEEMMDSSAARREAEEQSADQFGSQSDEEEER